MLNLLPLLLAKAGAATLTTKVAVAGALSVAAIGTAGVTGAVPVEALLPGDSSTVVVEDDTSGDVPVEQPTETELSDQVEVETPEDSALEQEAPQDEAPQDEAPQEDAGKSALEALEAAQSRAPEQADAGLDRAREAVARAAERRSGAGTDADADASEETARPTGQPQRPAQVNGRAVPRAERGTDEAGTGADRD